MQLRQIAFFVHNRDHDRDGSAAPDRCPMRNRLVTEITGASEVQSLSILLTVEVLVAVTSRSRFDFDTPRNGRVAN